MAQLAFHLCLPPLICSALTSCNMMNTVLQSIQNSIFGGSWQSDTVDYHSTTQKRKSFEVSSPSSTGAGEAMSEGDFSSDGRPSSASASTPSEATTGLPSDPSAIPPVKVLMANRWMLTSSKHVAPADRKSPEIVDRKVKALLNKLTIEHFDSISDQIVAWANRSEKEKDGRTLIQVIRLVFETAINQEIFSELYARLCRKMMEMISSKVQDDGIKNAEGKPIAGGLLFRKYLLNRCQEDFERGWVQKDATAAAAATEATEDQTAKEAMKGKDGKRRQKTARSLGLIRFIGELFKLQMLTERIMHECIKKLLGNVENPKEEEIESLCKLLTTVGQSLDTQKAHTHMDVYFSRMKELCKSGNVNSRTQFVLQDIIELRDRKWIPRSHVESPMTIAQIHEAAIRDKDSSQRRVYGFPGASCSVADNDYNNELYMDLKAVFSAQKDSKAIGREMRILRALTLNSCPTKPAEAQKQEEKEKVDQEDTKASASRKGKGELENKETAALEFSPADDPKEKAIEKKSLHIDTSIVPQCPSRRPGPLNLSTTAPDSILAPLPSPLMISHELSINLRNASTGDTLETQPVSQRIDDADASLKQQIEDNAHDFFRCRSIHKGLGYFQHLPRSHKPYLVRKLATMAVNSSSDTRLLADLFASVVEKNICSSETILQHGLGSLEVSIDGVSVNAFTMRENLGVMIWGASFPGRGGGLEAL
ncbi:hypothetical protein EVG20_g840 [Dentipellis fragilis]|uniref:MIF4G domain-containing protein n=1 Tax=Dentipellis fragilis TaxID=205917 RepID=A0A4Y9ZDV0_9AGAM|nr:hypothetical protein EVG20_g840 [Dentipellis fragilis]